MYRINEHVVWNKRADAQFRQNYNNDGLVQDCSNSIVNALKLLQACTKQPPYR